LVKKGVTNQGTILINARGETPEVGLAKSLAIGCAPCITKRTWDGASSPADFEGTKVMISGGVVAPFERERWKKEKKTIIKVLNSRGKPASRRKGGPNKYKK